MEKVLVRHRLDLIVILIDTTTGRNVSERKVCFKENGRIVPFLYKGGGVYILVDSGHTNTEYAIQVAGYEDTRISVEYGESEKKVQTREVSLIPKETADPSSRVMTMKGHLDGLEQIEAIRLSMFDRTMKDFDRKRNIINFYGGTKMTEKEYGIYHKETMSFEVVQVRKAIDETSVLIKEPLSMPYAVKDPIVRIVKGRVLPDQDYFLRVRDDGQNCEYLIRYQVNGNTYFKRVDFRNEEERSLN